MFVEEERFEQTKIIKGIMQQSSTQEMLLIESKSGRYKDKSENGKNERKGILQIKESDKIRRINATIKKINKW